MRQYVNALSIADAEFRAELEQFARAGAGGIR